MDFFAIFAAFLGVLRGEGLLTFAGATKILNRKGREDMPLRTQRELDQDAGLVTRALQ
jgi:hypothetical protein